MRVFIWSLILIAASACNLSTEVDPATDDPLFDITGSWSYNAELIGNFVTCEISGLTIRIQQEGRRITGTTEGGIAECIFPDRLVRQALDPMPLRDGATARTAVIMSFGEGEMWRHAGSVLSASFMRGTTDMVRDFGDDVGVVEFTTGQWAASRL